MGLFDYIDCDLPLPERPDWLREFQTKDTPAQYMERYQIRDDGTLWHEEYDVEDHSDPSAEGLMALRGCMSRVNQRWRPVEFDGAIDFYGSNWSGCYRDTVCIERGTGDKYVSVEYRCVFVGGRLVDGPRLLSRTEQTEGVYTDFAEWNEAATARQAADRKAEGAAMPMVLNRAPEEPAK